MKTFSSKEIIERLKKALHITSDYALSEELGISKATLSNWKSRNSIDYNLVFSKCKLINIDWLVTGNGKMFRSELSQIELSNISNNSNIKKPYYDVDFICGFDEIINSQVSVPTANIIVQGFDKADFWCNVSGHSMEPKISHGDIIALRKCTVEDIQYGEIYAVVLDTIRTIKIIRKSDDPKKLRFIPINIENYDEKEYPISRILHIYEVIGSISKFF